MSSVESMLELFGEVQDELEVEILTAMSILFEESDFTKVEITAGGNTFFKGRSNFWTAPDGLVELEALHSQHCNRDNSDWNGIWTAEGGWDSDSGWDDDRE